jgi:hypothetical protein
MIRRSFGIHDYFQIKNLHTKLAQTGGEQRSKSFKQQSSQLLPKEHTPADNKTIFPDSLHRSS